MPNKYEDLEAEASKSEAPKQDKGFLTGDEALAEQEGKRSALAPAAAFANEVLGAVPGGKYLETQALKVAGFNPKDTVAAQHQLATENPRAAGAGAGAGAALVAVGTTGALGLPAAAGGAAGAAAVGAAEAGLLTPIYKLGELINTAEAQPTPLSVEQVSHAFGIQDVLFASGLTALLHAPAMLVAGARGAAQSAAGRSMKKSAGRLEMEPGEVGRKALDTGILEKVGNAKRQMQDAGSRMGEAVKSAQIDSKAKRDLAQSLVDIQKNAVQNPEITPALAKINAVADAIVTDAKLDGPRAHAQVLALKDMAKGTQGTQAKMLYLDAAKALESTLEAHLDLVDPQAGSNFKGAKQDYHLFSSMKSEADALAERQLTAGDVAGALGGVAAAHKIGSAIGGPAGAGVADLIAGGVGAYRLKSRNTAVLLNKFANGGPSFLAKTRLDETVAGVLNPAITAQSFSDMDDMKRYDDMVQMLRNHTANPDSASTSLREHLDFLPATTADAVTANTMEKINKMSAEIPSAQGPATAFGIQTNPSDREKREFLRRCDAKFDPYRAVMSGRKDLIQEAERCNPETVHEIKKAIIDRISKDPDSIDYVTRRKIYGILGLPGVPGQDPTIGARIQGALNVRKEAQDSQGQMKSARQSNANLKNNSATLTRAQKILNTGE